MKILMVAAGVKPSKKLFEKYISYCDKTIAIDKGTEIFIENKITPDYVVGDFDSLDKKYLDKIKTFNFAKFPEVKDYTDSDIALRQAMELEATEIIMLGMTGKRLDHFFGNIGLLKTALKKKIIAYIIDDFNIIFLKRESFTINGEYGNNVSFYALDGVVKNLTIKNAKYELEDYDLDPFESLCNSNEFLDKEIKVSFTEGNLLVIYSKE